MERGGESTIELTRGNTNSVLASEDRIEAEMRNDASTTIHLFYLKIL